MVLFGALWIAASTWAATSGRTARLAALCLLLGLFQIGNRAAAHVARGQFTQIGSMLWLPVSILPERVAQPPYPRRQTHQGLVIYVARVARYDTPLPNTRFFNPWLQLRVPGNLAKGFQNRDRRDTPDYGYTPRLISIKNRGQLIFDQ
jgi:hypothetical protein